LIVIVPDAAQMSSLDNDTEKPLDPEPVQKWAEEGYAVTGITVAAGAQAHLIDDIAACVAALKDHSSADTKEKFGIVVNDTESAKSLGSALPKLSQLGIACIVALSGPVDWRQSIPLPIYVHQIEDGKTKDPIENLTVSKYPDCKPTFLLPNSADYQSGPAGIAHTRSLVFLREHLGGPSFDLEAIWEEHTYWEFERRSVAQTMATMVVSYI
jgi:carboxymethylenebutenolidase